MPAREPANEGSVPKDGPFAAAIGGGGAIDRTIVPARHAPAIARRMVHRHFIWYEQRYLFATDASVNGIDPQDAATTMQNKPTITKRVYSKMSAAQRGNIHNATIEFMRAP